MRARGLLWLGPVALLVLAARWLTYALAPASPLTTRFEASAGGAGFVVVTLVSLGLAAAISSRSLWLAVLGVRERQRLRPERELPRIRLRRLALRAIVPRRRGLARPSRSSSRGSTGAPVSASTGSRACSARCTATRLPLLAALSLLAAALAEAVAHLYAWMRATARALLAPAIELLLGGRSVRPASGPTSPPRRCLLGAASRSAVAGLAGQRLRERRLH